jgi:serine phosphatase RsbU (regulator of sigma subunit)
MLGKDPVLEIIRKEHGNNADGILESIIGSLDGFRQKNPLQDDVTLVVTKIGKQ